MPDQATYKLVTDPTVRCETVNVIPAAARTAPQIETATLITDTPGDQQKRLRASAVSNPQFRTVAQINSTDAAAAAVIAAMSTPPNAARAALINTFVVALKAAAVWDDLDIMYAPAAATQQAGNLNWKAPASFTAIPVNTPTFTADRGYTGDGVSMRVRTQWVPSTNGVKFLRDDCSVWSFNLTNVDYTLGDIGGKVDATKQILFRARSTNTIAGRMNDGALTPLVANGSSIGMWGLQRTGATTRQYFKNGAKVATSDGVTPSVGVNADEQWFLGCNSSGFYTGQHAFAAWGASCAGKEAAFYAAVLAYMQGVGAQ